MHKTYYSWAQIESSVLYLNKQLTEDHWIPDYIVGISRGGLTPAVMLSNILNVPMRPLAVSLRDHVDTTSDCGMAEDALGYNPDLGKTSPKYRKKILVVDDINDTGATIAWIKQDWESICFPDDPEWSTVWGDNVRFAVLVNNQDSNQPVDYFAHSISKNTEDTWIVYPWESWWSIK